MDVWSTHMEVGLRAETLFGHSAALMISKPNGSIVQSAVSLRKAEISRQNVATAYIYCPEPRRPLGGRGNELKSRRSAGLVPRPDSMRRAGRRHQPAVNP